MKKLKILVLFDSAGTPPPDQDYTELFKEDEWFTEAAVVESLQNLGHQVRPLGIYDNVQILLDALHDDPPDVVFNQTELFMGKAHLDKNIPALLELLDVPYTGCGPTGLALCNNKALSKKILTYHRVHVPRFHTFRKGKRVWVPRKMSFPMMIKPLREEASTGISQASYVENEDQFKERIRFVHESMDRHVIAEEYIRGRELYVSVLGNKRLWAFPLREMKFTKVPEDEPKIATYKAKWDDEYRERWGIHNGFVENIPNDVTQRIFRVCKRAYRALHLDSYARFDCRLTPDNETYILEGNANPELAMGDEFAESAERGNFSYEKLLTKMIKLAFTRE